MSRSFNTGPDPPAAPNHRTHPPPPRGPPLLSRPRQSALENAPPPHRAPTGPPQTPPRTVTAHGRGRSRTPHQTQPPFPHSKMTLENLIARRQFYHTRPD